MAASPPSPHLQVVTSNSPRQVAVQSATNCLVVRIASDGVAEIDLIPSSEYEDSYGTVTGVTLESYGVLGLLGVDQDIYLIVITEVLSIMTHNIPVPAFPTKIGLAAPLSYYQIARIECIPLTTPSTSAAPPSLPHLQQLMCSGNLYFSLSTDTQSRVTERMTLRQAPLRSAPFELSLPASRDFDDPDWPTSTLPNISPQFVYNLHALSPLLEFRESLPSKFRKILDDERFFAVAMAGFVGSRVVGDGTESPVVVTVVSRVDRRRSGTLFGRRGVDPNGNVAVQVETETIVRTERHVYTLVILRGSPPMYWKEELPESSTSTVPGNNVISVQSSLLPLIRHFENLLELYPDHRIGILSLLDGVPGSLEASLQNSYRTLWKSSNAMPEMEGVDWVDVDGSKLRLEDMDALEGFVWKQVGGKVRDYGAVVASLSPDGRLQDVLESQRGIFRVNSRECLDRTNVMQAILSLLSLNKHFTFQTTQQQSDVCTAHRKLFAENGDALAHFISGSGALFSELTATGHTAFEHIQNQRKMKARAWQAFHDTGRQDAFDRLTGQGKHRRVPDCAPSTTMLQREGLVPGSDEEGYVYKSNKFSL